MKIKAPQYMPYPPPADTRSGMKVSWNYYKTEAEAQACAAIARSNASIALSEGYDFGYQSPGSINKPDESGRYAGLWEVCLP